MEVKLLLLFCWLIHRQYPIFINGESIKPTTSSLQNSSLSNGTNIAITNYQTKITSNVTKALLQEMVGNGVGLTGGNSGEKMLSRKITKTENTTPPTDKLLTSKRITSVPVSKTSAGAEPERVAENVVIEVNAVKKNKTSAVKQIEVKNIDKSEMSNQTTKLGSLPITGITTTKSSISNATTLITSIGSKSASSAQTSNDSMVVKSTNSSITKLNSTTTSTTTTTTTTTTTPKPKKPTITFGLGDFPHLPGEPIVSNNAPQSTSSKLPVPSEPIIAPNEPNAQPSQELSSAFNYHSSRDYIVPIMTILFTIPLAIGVVITTYRRFRDCWSTRHYRRMDFLVDGMYND